jgi:hypothetical protein
VRGTGVFNHRGYRIDLQRSSGSGWEALIWSPANGTVPSKCIQSAAESARSLVLMTAVGAIDAEIYRASLD